MEEAHRQILRNNRSYMVENIAKPLDVSELLFEKDIFTESMKQDVEAETTPIEQIRYVLNKLPSRGPRAFDTFIQCLRESNNSHVVKMLRGQTQVVRHDEDLLPTGNYQTLLENNKRRFEHQNLLVILQKNYHTVVTVDWPNREAILKEIHVTPTNAHSEEVRRYWDNTNVYSMKKRRRGRCIIISNKMFTGPLEKDNEGKLRVTLKSRQGTDKDALDVEKLFEQLHFTVVVHRDKKAEEIKSILRQEARHEDQVTAECFVFVICSHGTSTGVYGTDGAVVSLETITNNFDGQNCPALCGKPKLFFIQACQGESVDRQSAPTTVSDIGQDLSKLNLSSIDGERENPNFPPPQSTGVRIPVKADIMVACATHPGYVSIRNDAYGTWFLQAVVYVFQHHAHKESILDLFLMVNNLVSRGSTEAVRDDPGGVMQVSNVTHSFRLKLFFFPGLVADVE